MVTDPVPLEDILNVLYPPRCERNCDDDKDGKCDRNCDTDDDWLCDLNCDLDDNGACDLYCDTDGDGACDTLCGFQTQSYEIEDLVLDLDPDIPWYLSIRDRKKLQEIVELGDYDLVCEVHEEGAYNFWPSGIPDVLVDYPEQARQRIRQGELYITSDDPWALDVVETDLINSFSDAIVDIRPLFPETGLLPDILVQYDTDQTTYQDIVSYLNSKDVYTTPRSTYTDTQISVHPALTFSVEQGQETQWLLDDIRAEIAGWGGLGSLFGVQSYEQDQQWYLNDIWYYDIAHCADRWRPVKIAIIDNWFDKVHPDLDDKIFGWYDEADQDEDIQVPNYESERNHGTKEAWLVWAEHNDVGIDGIFPNSQLILIKSTKDEAYGRDITNGIEAIARAYEMWAEVINLSRWGFGAVPILERVTKAVTDEWVDIVAAAGNYNKSEPFYPAAYDHVIWVAATDEVANKANFSNYGRRVDVAAPWVNILTTDLDNSYEAFNGTSEAAPLVAGAIWLARSLGMWREDIQAHLRAIEDKNIWEWVLDVRFMCDALPEWREPLILGPEHGVSDLSRNTWWSEASARKLRVNLLGLILLLLGILLAVYEYSIRRQKEQEQEMVEPEEEIVFEQEEQEMIESEEDFNFDQQE